MSLTDQDVQFVHAVADAVETVVIANCSQGRWRAGSGVSQDRMSSLRLIDSAGQETFIGTAIDMKNQRAMMAAQPEVLRAVTAALRAVDTTVSDDLGEQMFLTAELYNRVMTLKVTEPALTA